MKGINTAGHALESGRLCVLCRPPQKGAYEGKGLSLRPYQLPTSPVSAALWYAGGGGWCGSTHSRLLIYSCQTPF